MTSMWRKAMVYLGLGPDEEYDDYDLADESSPASRVAPSRPQPARPVARPSGRPDGPPGPYGSQGPAVTSDREPGAVRPLASPRRDDSQPARAPERQSAVRPIATPAAKPHVVSPSSFNDVQEVADKFKSNQPVIVNLQGADRDLSRRLIDFASGLCYGLGGQMERVADQVYLLTPTNVEVSAEERRRLQERGLVDR